MILRLFDRVTRKSVSNRRLLSVRRRHLESRWLACPELLEGRALLAGVVFPNLPAGSKYQIAFETAGMIGGQSKSVDAYNAFVVGEAAAGQLPQAESWRAWVSTSNKNAKDNAPFYLDVPIYNTRGQLVAANSQEFFYPIHKASIGYNQFGLREDRLVYTGSSYNGIAAGGEGAMGAGSSVVTGSPWSTATSGWVSSNTDYYGLSSLSCYAVSPVFTVSGNAVAPSAPSGVAVASGNGLVALSWTAPSSNGGSPITDYVVQYRTSTASTWSTANDGTSTATSATVTGLTNGTPYVFRVAAVNAAGTSDFSTPSTRVTPQIISNFTDTFDGSQSFANWSADPSLSIPDYNGDYVYRGGIQAFTLTSASQRSVANLVSFMPPHSSRALWSNASFKAGNVDVSAVFSPKQGIDGIFNLWVTGSRGPQYSLKSGIFGAWYGTQRVVDATSGQGMAPTSSGTGFIRVASVTGQGGAPWSWDYGHWYSLTLGVRATTTTVVIRDLGDPNKPTWSAILPRGYSWLGDSFRIGMVQTMYTPTAGQVWETNALVDAVSVVNVTSSTPSAPTNLLGTAGNSQANLTWTAPSSNDGSLITDYKVQYSSNGGSPWSDFNRTASTATSATVTGLTNGTPYVFRVSAVNGAGTGEFSTLSAPVTPRAVPTAPRGLIGTPGDRQVRLTWSAPASDGGSQIIGYVVEFKTTTATAWTRPIRQPAPYSPSYTAIGLTNGQPYMFRVALVNAAGTGDSAVMVSTPRTVATAPTNLVGRPSNGQLSLTWTAPSSDGGSPITDYVVEYMASTASQWLRFPDGISTATSATVTGLTNGTAYLFRVAGVNAAGIGGYTPTAVKATPVLKQDAVVGRWKWFNGDSYEFLADGQVIRYMPDGTIKYRTDASWRHPDANPSRYLFTWGNGEYRDDLLLSSDGKRLQGKNQYGYAVTGQRISS